MNRRHEPPNPLDEEFTAEEQAERMRAQLRHGVGDDHPVMMVISEMILYRRQYREILEEFKRVAGDVRRPAAPAAVRLPAAAWPWAALTLVAIATAAIAALAWFAGATAATAELRTTAPAVARVLTTQAGRAALKLLETNGDALPTNLARCRPFVEAGRRALNCNLWADGSAPVMTPDNAIARVWAAFLALPAWPLAAVVVVGLAIAAGRAAGRQAARRTRG